MESTNQLIKELWSLWESMAECGELSIGPKFSAEYTALKARVEQKLNKHDVVRPASERAAGGELLPCAHENKRPADDGVSYWCDDCHKYIL